MIRPAKSEQIAWIDLLRILACFLVVLSHCCDPFVAHFDSNPEAFRTGVFLGSAVRCCVPLFVMISGTLLLPACEPLGAFYRRRIGRLLTPLAFWSIALPLLFFGYLTAVNPETTNPAIAGDHTWDGTVTKLWSWIFNFNYDTTPLWYLYLLAGLYLIMPILGSWLQQAERRDVQLFLGVWGLTLLLPYLGMLAPMLGYAGNYGHMGLYGLCDWNSFGSFHYVSGFIGYLVLAYYLKRWPPTWNRRKTWAVAIPMFAAGYAITALGYLAMQRLYPGNYAYLEIVWFFAGINVFLMTLPVYLLVSRLKLTPRRWIQRLASLTFGIYLCHFVLVAAGYDLFAGTAWPPILRIAAAAVTVFAASAAVVWLLQRIPELRKTVA